jgi:hypothetical protein
MAMINHIVNIDTKDILAIQKEMNSPNASLSNTAVGREMARI